MVKVHEPSMTGMGSGKGGGGSIRTFSWTWGAHRTGVCRGGGTQTVSVMLRSEHVLYATN